MKIILVVVAVFSLLCVAYCTVGSKTAYGDADNLIFIGIRNKKPKDCRNIPRDYVNRTTGFYKLHNTPTQWNVARKVCEQEGAHLAIINSEEEHDILVNIIRPIPPIPNLILNEYVLLGFHDLYDEGIYLTIHDEPLGTTGFVRWKSGEPNNYKNPEGRGTDNCGSMFRNGGLADNPCFFPQTFICELNA